MNVTKNEVCETLKKLQSKFERLQGAYPTQYMDELGKFLNYLDSTPLIRSYIDDCGPCSLNVAQLCEEVETSGGKKRFPDWETHEEEVRNISAILHYMVENKKHVMNGMALSYSSSSRSGQGWVRDFTTNFVGVLFQHIVSHLKRRINVIEEKDAEKKRKWEALQKVWAPIATIVGVIRGAIPIFIAFVKWLLGK